MGVRGCRRRRDLGKKNTKITMNESQIDRYFHHIALKDIGGAGQRRLFASKVLVVGVGGLGSPAAFYLGAAGVGTIGLVDDDRVELNNLQRQIIHSIGDIGRLKTLSASQKIMSLNSDVKVVEHNCKLDETNADSLIKGYDFIIDATDNFQAKFLINDACVRLGKAYSHGGVVAFSGQTFTYVPKAMCLRCVFENLPEAGCVLNCRGMGILGTVAGIIGSIQATEAIKYLIKSGDLLSNRMLKLDALGMEMRVVNLSRNKSCKVCSDFIS